MIEGIASGFAQRAFGEFAVPPLLEDRLEGLEDGWSVLLAKGSEFLRGYLRASIPGFGLDLVQVPEQIESGQNGLWPILLGFNDFSSYMGPAPLEFQGPERLILQALFCEGGIDGVRVALEPSPKIGQVLGRMFLTAASVTDEEDILTRSAVGPKISLADVAGMIRIQDFDGRFVRLEEVAPHQLGLHLAVNRLQPGGDRFHPIAHPLARITDP